MTDDTERRATVDLDSVSNMVRDCAVQCREDGLDEVADALEAVADLPQEDRAAGVAVLVRLGVQFGHMYSKAKLTQDQRQAGWN